VKKAKENGSGIFRNCKKYLSVQCKDAWNRKLSFLVLNVRECSGMIHFITSSNHPSNPQQPIHSRQIQGTELRSLGSSMPLRSCTT
jgi:hypothetical protein